MIVNEFAFEDDYNNDGEWDVPEPDWAEFLEYQEIDRIEYETAVRFDLERL